MGSMEPRTEPVRRRPLGGWKSLLDYLGDGSDDAYSGVLLTIPVDDAKALPVQRA